MLKLDALNQLKQLKSDIKASRNLHLGRVKGTGQKFGFVALDSGKDIFLPPSEMLRVLPGDRIEVEVKKDEKNKTFAQVERLVESVNKEFFGRYVVKGKACFAEADFDGSSRWIFIPPNKRGKTKEGDLLVCRLLQHPIKEGKPQAQIVEVLGNESEPGIKWKYSLAKHHVREKWSKEALSELESLSEQDVLKLSESRKDLTDLPFFTVDGERTTDMDDALCVIQEESGWQLMVAIADPEALLCSAPALEAEALLRGSSFYAPGKVISMLPEKISSDLCSLVPEKKRLAKVFTLNVSSEGEISRYGIEQAVICSKHKLSYAQASSASELDEGTQDQLSQLRELASKLLGYRKKHANVQEGRTEFYLEIGEDQRVSAIKPKAQHESHGWIEECMLAANLCAARFLQTESVPAIFIGHSGVRGDRLDVLQSLIKENIPDLASISLSELAGFVKTFQTVQSSDAYADWKNLILRQMERTSFLTEPNPHFGLGYDVYTTATSPLRKANDYLIHKQIRLKLEGVVQIDSVDRKLLLAIESAQEASRNAAYDIDQWLKCEFISGRDGEFEAEVVKVFTTGMQVRLTENGIEGLVSARDIEGKCSFNQDLLTLKTSAGEFKLAQSIKVKLKGIDWSKKQVQFSLI